MLLSRKSLVGDVSCKHGVGHTARRNVEGAENDMSKASGEV